MKAGELYQKLDQDFRLEIMKDNWSFMNLDPEYLNPGFRENDLGLVLDNAEVIEKVYTATFPDQDILDEIFKRNEKNVLLFSHHAMGYEATDEGFPFYDIPLAYLKEMRERSISFYMLHTPLDHYGEYSTSVSFAKAMGLEIIEPFCQYDENTLAGVICKTRLKSIEAVNQLTAKTVGHETKLYQYGDEKLRNGRMAVAAGGGSYPLVVPEIVENGINCYITGYTKALQHFEPTLEFHRLTQEHGINVIGATHYSTEKFACMAMVEYFNKLGLRAEFLEGTYYLKDL